MLEKSRFLLIFVVLLLSACRTINRSNAELGVPASMIIFSFDDGPNSHGDTTGRLLDVLKKYEIQAMFCLLGENVEANPELARRIYLDGHIVINHGYSDKRAYRMGEDEFRGNLVLGETAIAAAIGKELNPRLYRPHGGYFSLKHEKICSEAGCSMILSSVRVYDAVLTREKKDKAVKRIIDKIEKQNGGIVLLHDARDSYLQSEKKLEKKPSCAYDRSWIPDAVEEVIITLRSKGFVFGSQGFVIPEDT